MKSYGRRAADARHALNDVANTGHRKAFVQVAGSQTPSNIRLVFLAIALAVGLVFARGAAAEVIANWGTVSTPISSDVTFSFAQYDITSNFSHQYLFSLEGSAGATYTVTFAFDPCRNGCGNPSLSYGIYDTQGGLVDAVSGSTYQLTAGSYYFGVKGDGMGSGNIVDYSGSVVIAGLAGDIVSPVPEPEVVVLMMPGLMLLTWVVRRRRARERESCMYRHTSAPIRRMADCI